MTRIERLRKGFAERHIDAFLVTDPTNITYLTGFNLTGGDGALLVTERDAIMITDARYQEALRAFASDEVVATITADYWGSLNQICRGMAITVLGFEESIEYRTYDRLDDLMNAALVPFDRLVERERRIKSAEEIGLMEKTAALHDEGYAYLLRIAAPGKREDELALELDYWMKKHGASAAAFPLILASGPNSAQPHATVSRRRLAPGDLVTLDFGYLVNGYVADVSRTFAVGHLAPELVALHRLVDAARQSVVDHLAVGMRGDQADAWGRKPIEDAGYGKYFNHGMGHGIGMAIHEFPASYGPKTRRLRFQTNEVLTVEPGIYLPGLGGIRIEDDVVLTHAGARVLTKAPTALQIVAQD